MPEPLPSRFVRAGKVLPEILAPFGGRGRLQRRRQLQTMMAEHPLYDKLASSGADLSSMVASLMLARRSQKHLDGRFRKPAVARLSYRAVAGRSHFGFTTPSAIRCASAGNRRVLSGQQVEELKSRRDRCHRRCAYGVIYRVQRCTVSPLHHLSKDSAPWLR
jgi:hypothetical protein